VIVAAAVALAVVVASVVVVTGGDDGDDADDNAREDADADDTVAQDGPPIPTPAGELAWSIDGVGIVAGVVDGTIVSPTTGGVALFDMQTGARLVAPVESFPLRTDDVAVYALGASGTGTVAFDPATAAELWRSTVTIADTPGDGVVVGTDGDDVVALDTRTGDELWRATVDLANGPTLDDGLVLWSDADDVVHAVDASDGERRWEADGYRAEGLVRGLDELLVRHPEPSDGVVLVHRDGQLVALEASDGTERWAVDGWLADRVSVYVDDGITIVGLVDDIDAVDINEGVAITDQVGIDTATGAERWRHESAGVTVDRIIGDHVVYLGPGGWPLVDVRTDTVTGPHPSPPAAGDGFVTYAEAGQVLAVEPDTGAARWTVPVPGAAHVAVAGGTVVVATEDGQLVGLDSGDGAELWRIPDAVYGELLPTSDGIVVLGIENTMAVVR
jgi:outer membrane protein assembly factor BamB